MQCHRMMTYCSCFRLSLFSALVFVIVFCLFVFSITFTINGVVASCTECVSWYRYLFLFDFDLLLFELPVSFAFVSVLFLHSVLLARLACSNVCCCRCGLLLLLLFWECFYFVLFLCLCCVLLCFLALDIISFNFFWVGSSEKVPARLRFPCDFVSHQWFSFPLFLWCISL